MGVTRRKTLCLNGVTLPSTKYEKEKKKKTLHGPVHSSMFTKLFLQLNNVLCTLTNQSKISHAKIHICID